MTLVSCGAHVWIKTNIAIVMISICAFVPLHSATSLASRSNHTNTSISNVQGQRVSMSNHTASNNASSSSSSNLSTEKQSPSTSLPVNGSSQPSTTESGDFLENGELLVDPSYPISRIPTSDEIQVLKPSKIVGSPLLTAVTPSPTGPFNNSNNLENWSNHTIYGWNDTRKMPLLSGSMTIALPTATRSTPPPTGTPNATISSSSLPTNTVIGYVTADANMPSTPTTSTQFVYATNTPLTSSRNSNPLNSGSASCHSISSTSFHKTFISASSLILILVLAYL